MNVFVKVLLVALFTVAAQHLWRLFYKFQGYGNDIYKHYPGKCQLVKGFTTNGSEDMTLLPSGQLIITSGIDLLQLPKFDYAKNVVKGSVYVMDTNGDTSSVSELIVEGWPSDSHFTPHGVSHWVHENKSVSIFVILHLPERIARFLFDGEKTLTLTKVYKHSVPMRNLNAITATSEDSFYATNTLHYSLRDRLMSAFELLMNVPRGYVLHVSGDTCIYAADRLDMPNGIDTDNRHVYLATNGAVHIFTRNVDNTLQPFKVIPVGLGSIDNMKLDSSGNLWVGTRNIMREVLEYMSKAEGAKCHSTILRIRDPTGVAEMESVFTDDASLVQAASVAVYSKRRLLIGSIIDKMLSCDIHYLSGE